MSRRSKTLEAESPGILTLVARHKEEGTNTWRPMAMTSPPEQGQRVASQRRSDLGLAGEMPIEARVVMREKRLM